MVETVLDKIHCLADHQWQESDMPPALSDRIDMLEQILFFADVLWLSMDNTLSPAIHRRQVLAAQLHYLDNAPIDEIIELLGPPIGNAWLTRSTIEDWLQHEGVIRALAYNEIFLLTMLEQKRLRIDRMDDLIVRLTSGFGVVQVGRILGAPGLWQRLAFQYYYLEHRSELEICRRLQAAAQRGGYRITEDKLSVWLRGKHLIDCLRQSIARGSR